LSIKARNTVEWEKQLWKEEKRLWWKDLGCGAAVEGRRRSRNLTR